MVVLSNLCVEMAFVDSLMMQMAITANLCAGKCLQT